MDDFFGTTSAPTSAPANGGDFFGTKTATATPVTPVTATASNKSGGIINNVESALSTVAGKIGGALGIGSPKPYVPPTIPSAKPQASVDFFKVPTANTTVDKAVAALASKIPSASPKMPTQALGLPNPTNPTATNNVTIDGKKYLTNSGGGIISPYANDEQAQNDIIVAQSRAKQFATDRQLLAEEGKSLDLTDKNAVDTFNAKVNALNSSGSALDRSIGDLSDKLDQYNQSNAVKSVISKDKGFYGALGPTQEQQLEKGVTDVLLAGGLLSGVTEIAGGAKVAPLIVKAITQGGLGIGAFYGLQKAEQGLQQNASDPEKLLLFLGNLVAAGGLVEGLNKAVPKIGDALFQTASTKYSLPETMIFNPSEVKYNLSKGEMSDLAYALFDDNGKLNVQKVRDALQNGTTIEVPAKKIVTVAENPIWTKVKGAFGIEDATGTTMTSEELPRTIDQEKITGETATPKPEELQAIAEQVKSAPKMQLQEEVIPKYSSATDFISKTGINPDGISIKDDKASIVESSTGHDAILTELPIKALGDQKLETTNQEKYSPGHPITDPIEVTLRDGKYEIRDGVDRLSQAIANDDKTIPVTLEVVQDGKNIEGKELADVHQSMQKEISTGGNPTALDVRHQLIDTMGYGTKRYGTEVPEHPIAERAIRTTSPGGENAGGGNQESVRDTNGRELAGSRIGIGQSSDERGQSFIHKVVDKFPEAEGRRFQIEVQKNKLEDGKVILVDRDTPAVLHGMGFPDAITDHIGTYVQNGAFSHLYFATEIDGKKVFGAYGNDILILNPEEKNHENYTSGRIMRHETTHALLEKLPDNQATDLIQRLENAGLPLEAWNIYNKSIFNKYYDATVKDIIAEVNNKVGNEKLATEIVKRAGFVSGKIMLLSEYINETKIDTVTKKIDEINKILKQERKEAINVKAYNTQAINENAAVVGEYSPVLGSTDPIVEKFLNGTTDNTLHYGDNKSAKSGIFAKLNPFEGFEDLSTKIIEKLKGRDTVSKQFIEDLTNSGDVKQNERDIIREALKDEGDTVNVTDFANKVKSELLPLTVESQAESGDAGTFYEDITLPDDLRGSVKDYSEKLYGSPIKNSAANVHFQGMIDNYFGHTRIEDMAGSKTRRVIEVQSDLYQKGRLEKEEQKDLVDENREGDVQDFTPLKQYNNPSAHFRMVREEIKQAAIDGKTKLQFPTGETAMKIEGLEQGNLRWRTAGNGHILKPEELEVGKEISSNGQSPWVVTDILGDGKFKAVPKDTYDKVMAGPGEFDWKDSRIAEEFDISGKIDINNPIYKFYEKDLGRYLKNNYDAEEVTDDKGVSWYEVPVEPEMARKPVFAQIDSRTPEEILRDAEAKAATPSDQKTRFKVLNQAVEDSSSHDAFMRQVTGDENLKNNLAELSKDVRDAGYANLSDYYVKNKITSNNEKGVVPVRQYRESKTPVEEKPPVSDEIKRINVSNKEVPMSPENAQTLDEIKTTRAIIQDQLDDHPGKKLVKFISNKEGIFEDMRNPENARTQSERNKIEERNKMIVKASEDALQNTQYHDQFDNPDVIRAVIDDYHSLANDLKEIKQAQKDFINAERESRNITKDEYALEKQAKKQSVKEMPESVSEVVPPIVKGGLQSPHLNFENWTNKIPALLNRDTFERNLEKVAPREDADALKKFIVDPVRENELNRIKFVNKIRTETEAKMKELGIKRNSIEDELIQKFGEGEVSLSDLQKFSPDKWKEIQSATNYFRALYDKLLNQWNTARREFGYQDVPKRPDYFRHFDELNFITENFGLLSSKNELPTTIAGKTEFFKPGKPFSTAELKRTGKHTKYSAIGGINNYIGSVSKQIFHIDSIQRGRALEKYFENSAEVAQQLGTPLHLSGVISNIHEYVNNGLAGKTSFIDRFVENATDRKFIKAFEKLSKMIGKNIIVGNLSTALSHLVSIPLIGATTDVIPLTKGAMSAFANAFSKEPINMIDGQESSYLTRRFPVEDIMPTMQKNIESALSFIFKLSDQFKSRMAVAGKYYEGLSNGLSKQEAMKQADIYGGKVIGDYSYGQKPNAMNAKTMSLIAQFQLGLNDSISVLVHDIPHGEESQFTDKEGNKKTKKAYGKIAMKFIKFAVLSYLFNEVLKQIRGGGKGIDPIDLGLTLAGANEEGAGKPFIKRLGLAATDLSGELPFVSIITGTFPLSSAIGTPIKDVFAGKFSDALYSVLADFASPIGGGLQASKTIRGIKSINKGQTNGNAEKAKAVIFGPTAVPGSVVDKKLNTSIKTAQTKLDKYDQSLVDQVKPIFDQAKAAGFGTPEADALVSSLTDQEYKVYKSMKSVDTLQNTAAMQAKITPIVQQANKVGFGTPEADALVKDLPDDEYAAYTTIKNDLYGKDATGTVNELPDTSGNSTSGPTQWDQQSFITHVSNLAKGWTTDPVTAFNDFITAGDWKIDQLKNGQIVVDRNDQREASEKKALGGGTTVTLDHLKSLELGGTNAKTNMWIIPKDQAAQDDQVENYLGKALKSGFITGKQAQEYELRYKKGADAAYIDARTKKIFDGVGDPMTFDDIKAQVK